MLTSASSPGICSPSVSGLSRNDILVGRHRARKSILALEGYVDQLSPNYRLCRGYGGVLDEEGSHIPTRCLGHSRL
jgi:hypothetical protein